MSKYVTGIDFELCRSRSSYCYIDLKAIDRAALGRVVVEFLRPATLTELVERLENRKLPAIDIVHFDIQNWSIF